MIHHLTPILNVSDVAVSMAWLEKLGWRRGFTWNASGAIPNAADRNDAGPATFASVSSGKAEIFLCLNGQGSRGDAALLHAEDAGGSWMSWWVAKRIDVDALHARAAQEGMIISKPPTDEPWGVREFHLRHPDGHTFRVSSSVD